MPLPPADFLFDASQGLVEDLELAALNRAANISKTLKREIDSWVEQSATAMLARWMIENRATLLAHRQIEVKPRRVEFLETTEKKKSA